MAAVESISAPHSSYLLNVSAENMSHCDLPTAKSRFLMDNLGYGLQTSKTATPNGELYLS